MLKRLTAACLLSFAGLGAAAQLPDSADMSAGGEFRRRIDRHTSTKAYRMLFVGTPLIVGGVVMQAYDSDFRRLRNGYSRSFRHDYDDWLQYAPAGAMVALKACGVRGRSSWGRMLVSDAFSAGLMAIGVNSLKYSCRVMRPDGSSRNSFPSGHTATAFMAATMLHKEYGHRSPWYSIGGYTVATVTGVTRQLNNRHWMSDIMVGAGIGILATELGYFLADLIFKEKGLNVTETYSVYDRCRRPSFLGFSLGFSTVPGSYTPYPGMHMQFLSGPAVSVQGAWFATPYWGFGGRMSCTNLRVKVNCATAILHLGGHYTPPGKIIIFGGTTDGNLERSVAYERQAHAGRSGADIRRAMERGNRYAARILTWASAGDMRNIALLERCRQEGRNAPDTGRFAVCPNCGNLYPSEYADWYCPACLTEGKRFVLFE